jgi:hypothetical protein
LIWLPVGFDGVAIKPTEFEVEVTKLIPVTLELPLPLVWKAMLQVPPSWHEAPLKIVDPFPGRSVMTMDRNEGFPDTELGDARNKLWLWLPNPDPVSGPQTGSVPFE